MTQAENLSSIMSILVFLKIINAFLLLLYFYHATQIDSNQIILVKVIILNVFKRAYLF